MLKIFQGWLKLNSNKKVACPLDCFDTCQGVLTENSIKGSRENIVTNGKLCFNFASLLNEKYLTKAVFQNREITLQEALDILVEKLKKTQAENSLFYKGSGNLGVMQSATKNFFSQYGSILTKGSLCDGAGALGLQEGRGKVLNPPIDRLLKSDVIIVWGRNFSVTSPHLYSLVKDKIFITIDPIKTDIAKKSQLHLQINPKTDYELALMLTRVAFMNNLDDEDYLDEFTNGHEWFFDIAKNRPLVSYEATTSIQLNDVYKMFDLIEGKSVSILVGVGVQKYFEGTQIMRCIDSFATYLGINKKNEAGGLWYLSDSNYGFDKQFEYKSKNKKVSIVELDFSSYDLVFIQGANPVVSAPNTKRVIDGLKKTFVVFFGTTFNETCEYADLIIPSCSFLSKRDVRLSYGHEFISISDIVKEKEVDTISEYDLAEYLIKEFNFQHLRDENEVIDYYINNKVEYEEIESFEFIEDIEIEPLYKEKNDDNFYLITAKTKKSLNSQFANDDFVYLHSTTKFKDSDKVIISSKYGQESFLVRINDDVKPNCALFFSGNKKVNYLTPHKEDELSNSAMYQEVLINIELS